MLPTQFFDFFAALCDHNSKEWFDEHRSEYERFVKKPFASLVQQLIDKIRRIDPYVLPTASDAIFRINRDIRFSKDKTPYKTSTGAFISRYGKKAHGMPGLYVEVSYDRAGIAGGTYMPDKGQLERIRDLLMHEGAAFRAATKSKKFIKAFSSVQGERSKILPNEFKEAAKKEPLIYHKQLFWWKELSPEVFLASDCCDVLFEYYMAQRDAQILLESALYDS